MYVYVGSYTVWKDVFLFTKENYWKNRQIQCIRYLELTFYRNNTNVPSRLILVENLLIEKKNISL